MIEVDDERHDETEDPDEDPSSSGFVSLIHHWHDESGQGHTDVEHEDLVGKIRVFGNPPCVVDGQEMGGTVEVRLHGAQSGRIVQLLLDANAALHLVGKLAYHAGKALETEDI